MTDISDRCKSKDKRNSNSKGKCGVLRCAQNDKALAQNDKTLVGAQNGS
jgi:hypothetical protein